MSRFATLTWLALRELWISFRLLAVIVLLIASAAPVVLLPHTVAPDLAGAPLDPLAWFAVALGGALTLVAAIAAFTAGRERERGTAGWLYLRAVPRPSILLGWFSAFALAVLLGLVPAAALAWLATGGGLASAGPLAYGVAVGATFFAGLVAVAAGLLLGFALPAPAAVAITVVAAAALLLTAAVGGVGWAPLPASGLALLGHLDGAARPVADALRGAGSALAASAILLLAGGAALQRADL
jgi:hypothetical protein